MALRTTTRPSIEFSMASMSDLVFLLLIFFMLTSTLIAPNALKLLLPQSNNQTPAKPQVSVSITPELEYFVGTKHVAFANIESLITKELKDKEDPTIVLHADKSVPIEHVVKVMNIARKYKYKVILATAPEN
jgi:biopolymer transport protein ExbD